MLYYSQNFEDIYLWRCFSDVQGGFYIDIGCYHPEFESITKIFYDEGWKGINVDPSTSAIGLFCVDRPRDINILAFACDHDGRSVDFFEVEGTGRSTGLVDYRDLAIIDGYTVNGTRARTVTINTLLLDLSVKEIHFLKIDAEGAEYAVLRGIDLSIYRPKVILFEAVDPIGGLAVDSSCIQSLLKEAAYHKVFFDGVNEYWCSDESSDLDIHFQLPPNSRDGIRPYQIYEAQKRAQEFELRLKSYQVIVEPTSFKPLFVLVSHPSPGLEQDREVVEELLTRYGHSVQNIVVPDEYYLKGLPILLPTDWISRAVVIMFEHTFEFSAKPLVSLLFVNPEWLLAQDIKRIESGLVDVLLAKSRDAEFRLKSRFVDNDVVFTGFSSRRLPLLPISPNYDLAIHVRGFARQKGSDAVLRAYSASDQQLPPCVCTMRTFDSAVPSFNAKIGKNCNLVFRDIAQPALDRMVRRRGLHLCPSEREGFGHYIFGPMSIGAIILTTDAPPMNELIDSNCGVLVPAAIEDMGLYVNAKVTSSALKERVFAFRSLPYSQKLLMGEASKNRADTLRNEFEVNFGMLIDLLLMSVTSV